ncbi:Brain-specific angiogenesis inhibitor 1-associated protein 2, partial [Armadillidium vulgare]
MVINDAQFEATENGRSIISDENMDRMRELFLEICSAVAYSFVLERLSTLGHHHLALYSKGSSLLQKHIDSWTSISNRGQNSDSLQFRNDNEVIYSTPEENLVSLSSTTPTKKRSQSLDGYLSDGERRSPPPFHHLKALPQQDYKSNRPLSKAKSDYNLEQCHRDNQDACHQSRRTSLIIPERKNMARATFPFHASADNQLNFEEGDVITLIGEKNKGWQYGENERTRDIGWFPVAYTECLEDEDSAIGRCSYNNDPPSLQSKVSHGNSKREDSNSYPQLRGQSLDRLENRKKAEKKVRTRSSSSNTPKRRERPLPLHSPSPSLRKILIEEEKGRTYYTIQSPSSSCTSENKKSFETFNSHLFLSDDMEEDLESYEGNYQHHQLYHRCKENKYTSFSADHPQNHSLPHSPASNEMPSCFRKSISSSRDSTHCSDDSGFSKEDNNAKRSSCSYSDCSRSCNSSWVTDSYEMCSDRNSANEDSYNPYSTDGRGSPTFLNYLYPTYKDYNNEPSPIKHCSMDGLESVSSVESRKENWIATAFGTLGKKKKNLVSPCAQKIASQKARKKNEKNTIHRSSSLLCIDMACTSSPDENCASDYEDITYATWHHKAKIEIPNILPSPPPYDPPPLPSLPSSTYIQYSEQSENSQNKTKNHMSNKLSESSSGNSSWSENDGSSKEDYMIIKEQNVKNVILKTENNQFDRRKILTRSYTWASPDFKKHSKGKKKDNNEQYINKSKSKLFKSGFVNPFSTNEKPERKKGLNNLNSSVQQFHSLPFENEKEDVAPPLPPRKRPQMPSAKSKKDVNIFNYSEYMCQRMTNPDGTCRFDQRSFTTG